MKRIVITICLVVMFVVETTFAQVDVEQGDKSKITIGGSIVGGD